jgi:N4-(beta-N-acetylglucosaminyl)-L-asparaginase
LIIADGGSTDKTLIIAANYGARIINIPRDKQGAEYNKGYGLQYATGKFILCIDHDNILPHKKWLEKSEYKPVINIENSGNNLKSQTAFAPNKLENGNWNHDTIGMVALDANGNLSGSCTTSGMGFKMRGRLGDSPIIGAGLFVDNEIGAATATGQGEDVIRICGSHLVVELMRMGNSPEEACKKAVERIIKIKGEKARDIQVGFIAINKRGEYGGYCIQKGFNFAVCTADDSNILVDGKHIL